MEKKKVNRLDEEILIKLFLNIIKVLKMKQTNLFLLFTALIINFSVFATTPTVTDTSITSSDIAEDCKSIGTNTLCVGFIGNINNGGTTDPFEEHFRLSSGFSTDTLYHWADVRVMKGDLSLAPMQLNGTAISIQDAIQISQRSGFDSFIFDVSKFYYKYQDKKIPVTFTNCQINYAISQMDPNATACGIAVNYTYDANGNGQCVAQAPACINS